MVNYEFWKDWKRKTKLEESAINSLKSAREIILKNIPRDEIVVIYAKGSFVRREMNKESDVDTSTIVKHSKWLKKLKQLHKKYRDEYEPKLEFTGYSLWELKTNKKAKIGKPDRPAPSRTVQHLEHYQVIYGTLLKKEEFYQGDNTKRLQSTINTFRMVFLPRYEKKEFGFSEIIKQVFWLVCDEQRVKGKSPPYHWGELAKSIKNKNHIIHDALRLRKRPTNDKTERAKFIRKLNQYLSELERLRS
ncbi:hypothetical protein J4417_05120 [Candidatus Woesearchaeota archaeon]|nr:hypothetical protein [Candidatus Woesearchaeota archaeon]